MKLIFKKPLVPNFVKTDKGHFHIKQLSDDEFAEFINLWISTIREHRKFMIKLNED